MSKKTILIISIIFLSIFSSCGNSNNDNQNSEVVNVGIYVYFYPFGYINNGDISGFDYDMMNEIAKASNFKVKFYGMKLNELLESLNTGKIDVIIAAMSVTEDRKKTMDFSKTYYISEQVILVKNDNEDITKIDDLIGKNVGVVKDTTGNTIMSNMNGVNVEVFDVGGSGVLALKIERIDAFVFDRDPCLNYLKYSDDIKMIEIENSIKEEYAIAVRKNDKDLLNKINYGLSTIMTNGVYEQLINKNFR